MAPGQNTNPVSQHDPVFLWNKASFQRALLKKKNPNVRSALGFVVALVIPLGLEPRTHTLK
ncbi:MAG TPA: hypothetical protein VD905_04505, partial [Flavobacteriales bacterium]|nr:hypothetical protein [Flavobacteriales bacterium]